MIESTSSDFTNVVASNRVAQARISKATNHGRTTQPVTSQRTKQLAIAGHPYNASPGLTHALMSSGVSLGEAMDALDEAQARSEGKTVNNHSRHQGTMTAFERQQALLDEQFGPVDAGPTAA